MRRLLITPLLIVTFLGCRYDPPPEVTLVIPESNSFVKGDPIRLEFSEPVKAASLEIRVWPGNKSFYDDEGDLLPGHDPVLDTCTPATSPCGEGGAVLLTLDAGRAAASIELTKDDAFGALGEPLRLEITGALEDDEGNRRHASTWFDFQIIEERWNPYADVVDPGDAGDVVTEPLEIREGFHLFHAEFTEPLPLPQQFHADLRVNEDTGEFIWVMIDSDPIPDAAPNTADPALLLPDNGDEGFIFAVHGQAERDREDPDEGLVFDTEPFTLAQDISGIYFELQDMVMHGRVTVNEESGRSRWDGTMAVSGVYLLVTSTGKETQFDPTQANFQIFSLFEDEIPDGVPTVCEDDPCVNVSGKCDLLTDMDWPPESVCN